MEQFKKRKRKVKMQRRTLRADDLVTPVASDQSALLTDTGNDETNNSKSRDHGSRKRGGKVSRHEYEPEEGEVDDLSKAASSKDTFKKPQAPRNDSLTEHGLNSAIAALLQVQTVQQDDDDMDESKCFLHVCQVNLVQI